MLTQVAKKNNHNVLWGSLQIARRIKQRREKEEEETNGVKSLSTERDDVSFVCCFLLSRIFVSNHFPLSHLLGLHRSHQSTAMQINAP